MAYARLSEALMAGEFWPGQPLLVSELARSFGTSTMPVRDAVRRLHAEGALRVEPQRGVRVRALDAAELAEITDLRELVEGRLTAMAATRLHAAELDALARLMAEVDQAALRGDPAAYLRGNMRAFFGIYSAAGQPVSVQLARSLWARVGPLLRLYVSSDAFEYPRGGWTVLLDALRRRDAEGARQARLDSMRKPARTLLADFSRFSNLEAPSSDQVASVLSRKRKRAGGLVRT